MDYRSLRYIITVAEEKNISKAAQKLYLSQPSLSHCILKQERQLGVTLFDRTKHPLQLTYAGERYIAAAHQILNIKEQLEKEMEDIANTKKGRVILGVTKTYSAYSLPRVISVFKKIYPDIQILLNEDINSSLESLLVTSKIEIAVLLMPVQSEHLCCQHLYDEEILLCLPADHPIIEKYKNSPIDLRLLKDEPFILYKTEQRVRKLAEMLFSKAGFKPKVILESQTAETILNLVSAGMGCAFIPKSVASYSRIFPQPVCFKLETPAMPSGFAWRRGSYISWAAQEFMKITREVFDEATFQSVGEKQYSAEETEFHAVKSPPLFRPE